MKEITLVQPEFVSKFSCIGSACRDHCCKGWSIVIDKASYNKYINSKNIEIKQISLESMELNKKSYSNWATINFNQQGNCPYLSPDALCNIYKNLGAGAMSNTCAVYPRQNRIFKKEEYNSLTLSCPEAARLLFSHAGAMELSYKIKLQPQEHTAPEADTTHLVLNLFCSNLLLVEQADIATNFYAIALFLVFAQKQQLTEPGQIHQQIPQLEAYYTELVQQLHSGEIANYLQDIVHNDVLQWQLLVCMQNFIQGKAANVRGKLMIDSYLNKMVHLISVAADRDNLPGSIEGLRRTWSDHIRLWLANKENKHILANYFLYRIYHDYFPNHRHRPMLQVFYLLMADFFFIKSLLAAKVMSVGVVDQEDFINVIYSFHSITKHSEEATTAFTKDIEKIKVNDDLSALKLLV